MPEKPELEIILDYIDEKPVESVNRTPSFEDIFSSSSSSRQEFLTKIISKMVSDNYDKNKELVNVFDYIFRTTRLNKNRKETICSNLKAINDSLQFSNKLGLMKSIHECVFNMFVFFSEINQNELNENESSKELEAFMSLLETAEGFESIIRSSCSKQGISFLSSKVMSQLS